MRIAFRPLSESQFEQLLKADESFAYNTGHGLSDISVFATKRRLRQGEGFIRNLLSTYGPKLIPLLKKYVLPATKNFAKNITTDVIQGKNLKNSLKERGKQSAKEVIRKVISGKGLKRKRMVKKNRKKVSRKRI